MVMYYIGGLIFFLLFLLQIDKFNNSADTLMQYGALGVMVVILVSLLMYILNSQAKERREWREDAKQSRDQLRRLIEDDHKAFDKVSDSQVKLSNSIEGIKVLLESIERRNK
jgi:Na+/melibiose symporter-like transporter